MTFSVKKMSPHYPVFKELLERVNTLSKLSKTFYS